MEPGSICSTATMRASCVGENPLDVVKKMLTALQETSLKGMDGTKIFREQKLKRKSISPINAIRFHVKVFRGEMALVAIELRNATDDVINEICLILQK